MIKVGLTGGIGSGKSIVAGLFELIGVPVYYADMAAKTLMVSDSNLKNNLIKILGKEAYIDENQLNKEYISKLIFSDQFLLEQINSLVHPAVEKDFESFVRKHVQGKYVVKEAAILLESGAYKSVDQIILVTAPQALRLSRVTKRDGVTEQQVLERIHKQWSDEQKQSYSDFQILNDDKTLLIPQVIKIHNHLNQIH